jgi:hypothetical protein
MKGKRKLLVTVHTYPDAITYFYDVYTYYDDPVTYFCDVPAWYEAPYTCKNAVYTSQETARTGK